MQKYDTIIIGGGAAGLMAAGQAATLSQNVLVLERMNRPGRKLSITGKGRCNITNTAPLAEFIRQVQPNGRFLRSSFSNFYSEELISFFNSIGVKTIIERGDRVFPDNGKAVEIVKSMVAWCKNKGVVIKTNIRVNSLIIKDDKLLGVRGILEENGKKENLLFDANKVIIATGGASYPATGSTGDGYKLAKSVGHKVNSILPSLVPLETEGKIAKELNGLELKNIRGTIWIDGKKAGEDFGEMSFTNFGITGPIVLSLSRMIVPAIQENLSADRQGKEIIFSIDLKSALDDKKLDNRLIRDFNDKGKETFTNILSGLLPKVLISTCIQSTKIDPDKLGHQISSNERKELRKWLKNFNLKVIGHRPFEEAIITVGGVDTNEVNQKSMESKLINGLFFAGEILDLDAPTGGYNLQIAFSTAWTAAQNK
ncbi:MAG: NAD(P)/FAD-dependent oxidoreductase [Bacteroidales bacterium]|jgi:predicted Rossmann fold flavoprotein|nr:NAD(P)/FAD-dependent oxidoreductase [Bacteroidales bacterium]